MAIDNSIYETLGERWYSAFDDPVALLRAESRVKLLWVSERLRGHAAVLDVGCGAGFLSNGLAKEGYRVTGIDLSPSSLQVAGRYDFTKTVEYTLADATALPFADESFNAVLAMDFLEHIPNPEQAIGEASRVLKPGGLFFFHTFNRNRLASLMVISMVEWLVKNTPKDMHVSELFIKPTELARYCERQHLQVQEMTGIRPRFSTITLKGLLTRTVPESFAFKLTPSLRLSYMGVARKIT